MSIEKIWDMLNGKLMSWFEIAVKNLPNLIVAVLVILFFIFLSKLVTRVLNNILTRITTHESIRNLALSFSQITITILGLFIALEILHLEKAVTSLLAGAGVIGLALGFAFQDIASNFVSGIFIAFSKPYKAGDIIRSGDYVGNVTAINLRTTTITTFQGLEVMVPNRFLFTEIITNFTNTPKRRIDLAVGVSYSDNLQKVEDLLRTELNSLPNRIESEAVDIFFTEFGDSSINLEVAIWVKYPNHRNFLITKSEAIKKIKSVFDNNSISIPFPIRTLDIGPDVGKLFSKKD
jgi:small conductance mechanosensitive channel